MEDLKALVLGRKVGQSLIFTVDKPCKFIIRFQKKRLEVDKGFRVETIAPECVNIARGEIAPEDYHELTQGRTAA